MDETEEAPSFVQEVMDRLRRAAPAVGSLPAEEEWAVELLEE